MRIKADILPHGPIICHTHGCPFTKECANHESAGDLRIEDGFAPELFEERGIVFCSTKEEPILVTEFTTVPSNFSALPKGAKMLVGGNFTIFSPNGR